VLLSRGGLLRPYWLTDVIHLTGQGVRHNHPRTVKQGAEVTGPPGTALIEVLNLELKQLEHNRLWIKPAPLILVNQSQERNTLLPCLSRDYSTAQIRDLLASGTTTETNMLVD
jgi:hypothetical protein